MRADLDRVIRQRLPTWLFDDRAQGSILEIPHAIRPAYQGQRHGNGVNRPLSAPASYPDFQGKFGLDANLARAFVGLEIGDLKNQRGERPA